MRTFGYLTLALAGLIVATTDASAGIFGRKGGGGNCCGGTYGTAYGGYGYGGYGGYGRYGYAYPNYGYSGWTGYGPGYNMYGRTVYGGAYTYPSTYGMYTYGSPTYGVYPYSYPSGTYATYPSGWSSAYPGTWSTAGTTMTTNGMGNIIQTTDGKYYVRGADGSYYAAPNGVTTTSGYTPYYTSPGVYQAGYPGYYYGYPGVIQTGGTQLQTMPGVTLPGGVIINPGGVTIPQPMPNK